MSELPRVCEDARVALHERLDGDEPGPLERDESHLESCAACRDWYREHQQLQRLLRDVELPAMSELDFRRLLNQTSRATPKRSTGRRRIDWRVAAAAIGAASLFILWPAGPPEPTDAELRRAAQEVRFVLGLTANTLDRAEKAAIDQVLGGPVSTTLKKIPVRWPDSAANGEGRNDDGS